MRKRAALCAASTEKGRALEHERIRCRFAAQGHRRLRGLDRPSSGAQNMTDKVKIETKLGKDHAHISGEATGPLGIAAFVVVMLCLIVVVAKLW
jgi:hypothetical protein